MEAEAVEAVEKLDEDDSGGHDDSCDDCCDIAAAVATPWTLPPAAWKAAERKEGADCSTAALVGCGCCRLYRDAG